jgi:serine O-acetyltransferase
MKDNLSGYENIVVWGTGSSGQTAHSLLGDRIDCFVDTYFDEPSVFGIDVRKPKYLSSLGQETIVIIASIAFREIQSWIDREAPGLLLVPARIWHTLTGAFFGIEVPVTVEAGAGLQFVHSGGIVIHDNARLGEFCRIYQNVTVGSDRRGKTPVLGDHVTMWAGAIAIGGCRLGDFTQVGANSVCMGEMDVRDVSLAGCPAKPVGTRQPAETHTRKPST